MSIYFFTADRDRGFPCHFVLYLLLFPPLLFDVKYENVFARSNGLAYTILLPVGQIMLLRIHRTSTI